MNFIHFLFPSLLKREESFLVSMQTPIVRVFNAKEDILFYDENRFKEFVRKQEKSFKSKYYKGLGTTKPEDVPDIFGEKMVEYLYDTKTDTVINNVFNKNLSDQRKVWIENYNPNISKYSLDDIGKISKVDMSLFLDNELIKFSYSDCRRSIPSLFDGLKCSQRKILFAVKKRKLTNNKPSLKVAQLGAYTAEISAYHHGEGNLFDTIIKMAQDFVGSNNVPLLSRDGMFGSRLSNGDDSASPRYIFTKMETITPLIYREEDDVLLDYVDDDGVKVEPTFYVPILPMILVNGAVGIGSGWSCSIPGFNPIDIVNCVKIWIENKGTIFVKNEDGTESCILPEIKPWYRGFLGNVEVSNNKITTYGILTKKKNKVYVSELPIGMSIDKFKENCEDWLIEKKIKGMKNHSTPDKVDFEITESEDGFICNLENMKLSSHLHVSNMVLFDENNKLKKYSITQIINDFCVLRYSLYVKRKKHIISLIHKELRHVNNKARFIDEVISNQLDIMNVDENIIVKQLEEKKYDKELSSEEDEIGSYDYLLKLQVRTFTKNKIISLNNELNSLQNKLNILLKTSESQMWLNELDEFLQEYSKWLANSEKIKKNKSKK